MKKNLKEIKKTIGVTPKMATSSSGKQTIDTLSKTYNVVVTDDPTKTGVATNQSVTTGISMEENDMAIQEPVEIDSLIQPQDSETIKYLSNVRDDKTNEISKPFVIADKRYQMVRGKRGNEVMLAVYCFDDMGQDGSNMIQSLEEFEDNVAGPMLEMEKTPEGGDPQGLDYSDLGENRHFFVEMGSGGLRASFKNIKEMMMSGRALGPDEEYTNLRELKKRRITRFMESENINETDMGKLTTDVEKLVGLIKTRFSAAFSKLDKPIEKVQFLDALGQEFGLTRDKINKLMTSLKSGVNPEPDTQAKPNAGEVGVNPVPVAEGKIMTKKQFSESIKKIK
jgi:hypothetical protein